MSRKRILAAHPYVHPWGGSNLLAAWALQALREEFDLELATLGPIDYAAVNRNFGTSLAPGGFRVHIAPRRYRMALRSLPTGGALMQVSLLSRWARALDAAERFDALLGLQNETPLGSRGIQYVHFPAGYMPRPENEMRWFHRIPGVLGLYRGLSSAVAGSSNPRLQCQLTLANSAFVAGKIKQVYGTEAVILHPPVPGDFPAVEWEQRRPAVIAIGRMHPVKRWEMAVEIVERARLGGAQLDLTLIAFADSIEYGKYILSLASSRPWFRVRMNVSRQELVREVAGHRYGIHTMEDEHFGIAPAELLRAGCIPFVHNSGGPVEIVANRRELLFQDASDGAEKISAVVGNPGLERDLRLFIEARRDCFSADRFCQNLRRVVRDFATA